MPKISEIKVSYRRSVQPKQYESAEASVLLNLIFDEGEAPDPDQIISDELDRVIGHVEGRLVKTTVAKTKPSPTKAASAPQATKAAPAPASTPATGKKASAPGPTAAKPASPSKPAAPGKKVQSKPAHLSTH